MQELVYDPVRGITVTVQGHIAVALQAITDEDTLQAKVIVV